MSVNRKHRIVLQPSLVDDICNFEVSEPDGSVKVIHQNDVSVLGSLDKLRERYGDAAQSILDSFKQSYNPPSGLDDDAIFDTIKSRNIQSAQSLADWFNNNMDSLKSKDVNPLGNPSE